MNDKAMDRGIWAAWYDLEENGREDYLAWLHEHCLPGLLRQPGYLWAAHIERTSHKDGMKEAVLRHTDDPLLPAGRDYLLLLGAVDAHVFVDPPAVDLQAGSGPGATEMLGRRRGQRTCIFAEVARVDGPAVASRGPDITPGPWIQMGSYNVDSPDREEDLSGWYANYMLPLGERLPGCVGLRKLVSIAGWARHGILYEFADLDSASGIERQHITAAGGLELKGRHREVIGSLIHAPDSPTFGVRIWPAHAQNDSP